jgi:hypothetical protein
MQNGYLKEILRLMEVIFWVDTQYTFFHLGKIGHIVWVNLVFMVIIIVLQD